MFTLSLSLIPLTVAAFVLYLHFNAKKHNRGLKDSICKREGEDRKWVDIYRPYNDSYKEGVVWLSVISLIPLILAILLTFGSYSGQISDAEDIIKFERLEEVYEDRAEALTQQFASYLSDIYPEHERNIFETIEPEGIDIYLVKYPDLKASETILELVAQIRSMQDDRYGQQIARENTMKSMRYRTRNPWIFNSFIPEG